MSLSELKVIMKIVLISTCHILLGECLSLDAIVGNFSWTRTWNMHSCVNGILYASWKHQNSWRCCHRDTSDMRFREMKKREIKSLTILPPHRNLFRNVYIFIAQTGAKSSFMLQQTHFSTFESKMKISLHPQHTQWQRQNSHLGSFYQTKLLERCSSDPGQKWRLKSCYHLNHLSIIECSQKKAHIQSKLEMWKWIDSLPLQGLFSVFKCQTNWNFPTIENNGNKSRFWKTIKAPPRQKS